MAANRMKWHRPELVVLVRSRPEEAVLTGCKGAKAVGPPEGVKNCKNGGNRCDVSVHS